MNSIAKGCLIFAANNIGNEIDTPQRSIEYLHKADLLIFEEHKTARKALKSANIHRDYLCFSEHVETDTIETARLALEENKTVLYMSNQGTPNVEDPGIELLQIAYRLNSKIIAIPGPCSFITALSVCPFYKGSFLYKGLLPQDSSARILELKKLSNLPYPLIILDTPYRRNQLIYDCVKIFNANRSVLLALDISGPDETYLYGKLNQIYAKTKNIQKKLNFILIIDGKL